MVSKINSARQCGQQTFERRAPAVVLPARGSKVARGRLGNSGRPRRNRLCGRRCRQPLSSRQSAASRAQTDLPSLFHRRSFVIEQRFLQLPAQAHPASQSFRSSLTSGIPIHEVYFTKSWERGTEIHRSFHADLSIRNRSKILQLPHTIQVMTLNDDCTKQEYSVLTHCLLIFSGMVVFLRRCDESKHTPVDFGCFQYGGRPSQCRVLTNSN